MGEKTWAAVEARRAKTNPEKKNVGQEKKKKEINDLFKLKLGNKHYLLSKTPFS